MFLRIGLGLTFIYIGVDILRHPNMWIGYVPQETMFTLDRAAMLRLGGLFDITIGAMLGAKIWPRLAGVLAVLHLMGIFTLNGIDSVLARNIGLLGTALAVVVWPKNYRRKRWWWQRRRGWRGIEEEG